MPDVDINDTISVIDYLITKLSESREKIQKDINDNLDKVLQYHSQLIMIHGHQLEICQEAKAAYLDGDKIRCDHLLNLLNESFQSSTRWAEQLMEDITHAE